MSENRQATGNFSIKDISSKRYGRLVAKKINKKENGKIYWECLCDCGNIAVVAYGNLSSGSTKSCGCLRRETSGNGSIKHGMYGTRIYQTWASMHKRCKGTSGEKHRRLYYDKGITVCEEWKEFAPFMNWAYANGYSDSLTIDRIDSNGGYSPDNCRWSDAIQQSNNRSNNHLLTMNGETLTVKQWAVRYKMKWTCLHERLRRGWSVADSITKPVRGSL